MNTMGWFNHQLEGAWIKGFFGLWRPAMHCSLFALAEGQARSVRIFMIDVRDDKNL